MKTGTLGTTELACTADDLTEITAWAEATGVQGNRYPSSSKPAPDGEETPMTTWTPEELDRIGAAEELDLASTRPDGTPGPATTMWVVRTGDDLYVRSADGPDRPWYVRAQARGKGRIRAGGVERDVTFTQAAADAQPGIDAAYHAKYDHHGARIVGHVTGPDAAPVTIRLVPTT